MWCRAFWVYRLEGLPFVYGLGRFSDSLEVRSCSPGRGRSPHWREAPLLISYGFGGFQSWWRASWVYARGSKPKNLNHTGWCLERAWLCSKPNLPSPESQPKAPHLVPPNPLNPLSPLTPEPYKPLNPKPHTPLLNPKRKKKAATNKPPSRSGQAELPPVGREREAQGV